MRQTAQALKGFFGGFGIPAYMSGNIPDNVTMPYITYDVVEPIPLSSARINASVWYKSSELSDIADKVDQIRSTIGTGLDIKTESGVIHLFPQNGEPFVQIMNDPNRETKRALLSMMIHCSTL